MMSSVQRQMWNLAAECKPYWRLIAFCLLMSVGSVICSLALPLGLRQVINSSLAHHKVGTLNIMAIGLIGLFGVRAVLSYWGTYLLQRVGEQVLAHMRKSAFERLIYASVSYFSSSSVGEISSRLTNDIGAVRSAITDGVSRCIYQALQLTGALSIMFVLNWRTALLVIGTVPLATIVGLLFSKRLRDLSKAVQDRLARTSAVADEILSSIRTVKAFSREDAEHERFSGATDGVFNATRSMLRSSALYTALSDYLFVSSIIMVFWYGGRELMAGRLTAGDFVAFLFYAERVSQSLSELSQIYSLFAKAAGASESYQAFMMLPVVRSPLRYTRPPEPPPAQVLTFEQVSFRYSGRLVLDSLSFQIKPGEIVALVGRSGAGKSTIINLVPRFYEIESGRIVLGGRDTSQMSHDVLRDHIALVSQDVELFNTTVLENIRYGRPAATNEEVVAAATAAHAHDFIMMFPGGYNATIGQRGMKISGGQRQRLSIARALLKNSPLLLLDEPTSSLDSESEALIYSALRSIMHERTTLVVAHRLSTIQMADRVIVLDKGHVVATGTHRDLLDECGLYRVLTAQAAEYASRCDSLV
jgi:subfamily B ATP-binding cassette protein MsbA